MYKRRLFTTSLTNRGPIKHSFAKPAFTIVELLIVVIVIAILATITIIAYNGITNQAKDTTLKSDLSNTATKLALYHTDNNTYPSSLTDDLKSQSLYTELSYQTTDTGYCLQATYTTDPNRNFHITEVGQVQSGECEVPVVALGVALGDSHTCIVVTGGKAYCWGRGSYGELGEGTNTSIVTTPTAVLQGAIPNGVAIKNIAARNHQSCALASDDKAYCWGRNGSNGVLGDGTTTDRNIPVAVSQGAIPGGVIIKNLALGSNHTCALASDDQVYCWGSNNYGESGATIQSKTPVAVLQGAMPDGWTIKNVSSGTYHSCATASDDKAYCWGYNGYGQLGDGITTDSSTNVAVLQGMIPNGVTIKNIVVGGYDTCAVASNNKAYCWGYNSHGLLGDGTTTYKTTPVSVLQGAMPLSTTIKTLSLGSSHTCAIASDDKVYCWGDNSGGQLGDGTTTSSTTPVAVLQGAMPSGATVESIALGNNHTCAIASDDKVYCWGGNTYGQLGDGTTTNRTAPVAVLPFL